jgi:hypothetical protein
VAMQFLSFRIPVFKVLPHSRAQVQLQFLEGKYILYQKIASNFRPRMRDALKNRDI